MVADKQDRDTGLLGDFLNESGATVRYLDRETMNSESVDADLVVLLGSNRSAHDPQQFETVATETALIRNTLAEQTPVIGICYGAQVLARALGGSSRRGSHPECGWTHVDSTDEELCPSGLWGQMHHDIIVPPESSTVIASSDAGPQAFIDESAGARAVGWQFHPELTLSTFQRWLAGHYSGSEEADPHLTLAEARSHADASRHRAAELFRSTLRFLGVTEHPAQTVPPRGESSTQPATEAICVLGYN